MKKSFPGYYKPTEDDFKKLWKECIFVFDANILLNLYQYADQTVEKFFTILNKHKSNIWVPHQVALEYQRNRIKVIYQRRDAHDKLIQKFSEIKNSIRSCARACF